MEATDVKLEAVSMETDSTVAMEDKDTESSLPTINSLIMGNLESFSEEVLYEKLRDIEVSFTCRRCKLKRPTLEDLVIHLDSCQPTKRGRGRPRIYPLLPGQIKPLYKKKEKLEKKVDDKVLYGVMPIPDNGRRATRISTGSIKRKNVAEILGMDNIKNEPSDDEDEVSDKPIYLPPPSILDKEEKTDNKQIVLSIESLIQAADQVNKETAIEIIAEENSVLSDATFVTNEEGGEVITYEVVEHPDKDCVPELSNSHVVEVLRSKYKSTKQRHKVNLIRQPMVNLVPVAESGNKPVIILNPEDTERNIVIPTINSSGESKDVVIPHSVLLQALKDHGGNEDEPTEIIIMDREQMDVDPDDPDYQAPGEEDAAQEEQVKPPQLFKRGRPIGRSKIDESNDLTHRCNVCTYRYFATKLELDVHLRFHIFNAQDISGETNENEKIEKRYMFKCTECDAQRPKWNQMLRHLITHKIYHVELKGSKMVSNLYGSFSCPICKKSFDKKHNMIIHHRRVHYKQDRMCPSCKCTFRHADAKTFKRHLDKCMGVIHQCDHCSYSTKVSINLRRHMKIHQGHGITCDVCKKVFPDNQRYNVHKRRHMSNRQRYGCEICGKTFLTVDAVKKHHERFHIKQEGFPCPQCNYVARVLHDLLKHQKNVHQKKYRCDKDGCDFATNSETTFQNHDVYHNPENSFRCPHDECYFSSSNAKLLGEHWTSKHNTESKHQCPVCQKFFKRKTHLLRHMVIHTGDHPYQCIECDTSFYSHSTYYRHRKKTGHDAKREGIASVPQNIIITYVEDEGEEESIMEITGRQTRTKKTPQTDKHSLEHLLVQQQGEMNAIMQQSTATLSQARQFTNPEQVVLIETTETQLLDHVGKLGHQDSIPVMNIISGNNAQGGIIVKDGMILDSVETHAATTAIDVNNTTEILDNIITIPEGEVGQQYTYIISSDATDNPSNAPMTLNLEENTIIDNQQMMYPEISTNVIQTMMSEEGHLNEPISLEEGRIETVVEVTPTTGGAGGQYAILLVPTIPGQEQTQGSLSMVQIKPSTQL